MIKVLPFSALKRHLQGEIFAPVDMGAHYELQSAARVMCGSNGNTYRFKTAENAALWLDTNTIKAVKNQITKQSAIDSLIIKNMSAPSDWLAEEITTLQARANGDWAAYHTGDDLLNEWGIIAKGDKGDKGDSGAPAVGGVLQSTSYIKFIENGMNNTVVAQSKPHGLGGVPDFVKTYFECRVANYGWLVGDRVEINSGVAFGYGTDGVAIRVDDINITLYKSNINSFKIPEKNGGASSGNASTPANWIFAVRAFKWVGGGI